MYEEILILTDGSDAHMAAVEQSDEPAAEFDATIHVLHVVDVGTEMSAAGVGNIADELLTALEPMATDGLDTATARADDTGILHERSPL